MKAIDEAFKLTVGELSGLIETLKKTKGAEALEALAVAYYRAGDQTEARASFAELPGGHEADVRSLVLQMRMAFADTEFERAMALARAIISRAPDNAEALRTAGRICNRERDFDRSEGFWRQLAEHVPSDAEAPLQVARIAARKGAWESADFYAELAERANPDATEPLQIRLDAAIKTVDGMDGLAMLLPVAFAKDSGIALRTLSIVLARDVGPKFADLAAEIARNNPDDQRLAELLNERCEIWLREAQSLETRRRDEQAAKLYAATSRLQPGRREALNGLSRTTGDLVKQMRNAVNGGDASGAAEIAITLQDRNPYHSEAAFVRGRALLGSDPHAAIEQFQRCVDNEPFNGWYKLNLGRALAKAEHIELAYEEFGAVLACDAAESHREEANLQRQAMAKAMMRQASAAYNDGDHDVALPLLVRCQAIEEMAERATKVLHAARRAKFLALKQAYADGEPDTAEKAEALTQYWPDNVGLWQIVARSYMNARNHRAALKPWQALAALEPDNAHYQLQIARCCSWLGKPELGLEAAQRALGLDAGLAEAQALMDRFIAATEPA